MMQRDTLDKNGYSNSPHKVNANLWYYEDRNGIRIVANGEIIKIPWGMLDGTLERRRKALAKRSINRAKQIVQELESAACELSAPANKR